MYYKELRRIYMKQFGKIIMGLSSMVLLTACQSNQTPVSSNEGKSTNENSLEENNSKTLALSDYLALGTKKNPLILYYADPSEGLGKETEVKEIFIIADSMITTYEGDLFENLGELAKLSDKEILAEIESRYLTNTENAVADNRRRLIENEEYSTTPYKEKAIESLDDLQLHQPTPLPYKLVIFTDDTGNQTSSIRIQFKEERLKLKDGNLEGTDQEVIEELIQKQQYISRYYEYNKTLKLDAPYLDFSQTSTVYDSKYRIFLGTSSDDCYISRLENQSLQITADQPGTKNIEVDPKE